MSRQEDPAAIEVQNCRSFLLALVVPSFRERVCLCLVIPVDFALDGSTLASLGALRLRRCRSRRGCLVLVDAALSPLT